jgi:hypothetical protein
MFGFAVLFAVWKNWKTGVPAVPVKKCGQPIIVFHSFCDTRNRKARASARLSSFAGLDYTMEQIILELAVLGA